MIYDVTLATTCYFVEDGKIKEGTLADFEKFIESTPRREGVGYKYYPTTITKKIESVTDDGGNEIEPERLDDVWVLAYWSGSEEVVVREFDSEEEAKAAAEQTYVNDILNNGDIFIRLNKSNAEKELKDLLDQ